MNIQSRCRLVVLALAALSSFAHAADKQELPQVLFQNVNIFNGTENKLYENHQVLVEGNLIKAISASEIKTRAGATVIDGGGRTLGSSRHAAPQAIAHRRLSGVWCSCRV